MSIAIFTMFVFSCLIAIIFLAKKVADRDKREKLQK
jgi:hypothetical protein